MWKTIIKRLRGETDDHQWMVALKACKAWRLRAERAESQLERLDREHREALRELDRMAHTAEQWQDAWREERRERNELLSGKFRHNKGAAA